MRKSLLLAISLQLIAAVWLKGNPVGSISACVTCRDCMVCIGQAYSRDTVAENLIAHKGGGYDSLCLSHLQIHWPTHINLNITNYFTESCDSSKPNIYEGLHLPTRPLTVRELMDANQRVYELVETYVGNTDLTTRYTQKAGPFKSLFESRNTTLYMDHIGWYNNSNRNDSTTLAGYCSFYEQQQGSFTEFSIHDVTIRYLGRNEMGGILYVSELTKQYRTTQADTPVNIRLALHITYSIERQEARITRIECKRRNVRLQPHIMANYEKHDPALYIPTTLKAKDVEGSIIPLSWSIHPLSAEVYSQLSAKSCATYRYDFEAQANPVKHHTISVSTVKNAVGVEAGYAQATGKRVVGDLASRGRQFFAPTYSERVFHIGAVYQRQLFARNRHRFTVETGVSLDMDWQQLTADRYEESREAIDPDGDPYTRLTVLSDFHERCRNLEIAVPVMLRYDGYVTRSLSLFASIGIRGSAFIPGPASATFDAYYAGQYGPEHFDVLIDNNYHDFGRFYVNWINDESPALVRWRLDALARVGAQLFFTPEKRWSAEFSVGGRYGLLDKRQNTQAQAEILSLSPDKDTFNSALRDLSARPPVFIECQAKLSYNF